MKLGLTLIIIGITLIIIGLVLGYFTGANMEHNVTALNIISVIATYLKDATIAIAFLVVGGLIVILGIKKS